MTTTVTDDVRYAEAQIDDALRRLDAAVLSGLPSAVHYTLVELLAEAYCVGFEDAIGDAENAIAALTTD